jgi:hypothetical protein
MQILIRNHFQGPVTVFTHLEPVKDPLSMDDIGIERVERKKMFYRFINSGPVIQKGNSEDTLSFLLFGSSDI